MVYAGLFWSTGPSGDSNGLIGDSWGSIKTGRQAERRKRGRFDLIARHQVGSGETGEYAAYILMYQPLIRSRSSTFSHSGPKAWSHMCGRL